MIGDAVEGSDILQGLGINALSFLASDPMLFSRFLRVTGLELENLRDATDDEAFLIAVLDFLIADENVLAEFSRSVSVESQTVIAARGRAAPNLSERSA